MIYDEVLHAQAPCKALEREFQAKACSVSCSPHLGASGDVSFDPLRKEWQSGGQHVSCVAPCPPRPRERKKLDVKMACLREHSGGEHPGGRGGESTSALPFSPFLFRKFLKSSPFHSTSLCRVWHCSRYDTAAVMCPQSHWGVRWSSTGF